MPSTGYIMTACGGVLSAMGNSVTLSHDKAQSKITIIPKFDKNLLLGIMIEIYKLF
jgi:hypothetical protein